MIIGLYCDFVRGTYILFKVTQTLDNIKGTDVQSHSSIYQDTSNLGVMDKDFEMKGVILVGSFLKNISRGKGDIL